MSFILSPLEVEGLIQRCESSNYGSMNRVYLDRSLDVIYDMLFKHPRICAIRVDLRFANETLEGDADSLLCLQRGDPLAITRFFESLKSQLREEHARQQRYGEPWLFSYVWCRELDTGAYPHYHLVLLFNRDHYAYLGDYSNPDTSNMATRIQKAWCSSLGLPFPDYAQLVHFPANRVYWVNRTEAINREQVYIDLLYRVAYLAKVDTKGISDGRRHFGCSQRKY